MRFTSADEELTLGATLAAGDEFPGQTSFRVDSHELVVRMPRGSIDAALLAQRLEDLGLPDCGAVTALRVETEPGWQWTSPDAAFLASVVQRLDGTGKLVPIEGLPRDLQHVLALARRPPSETDPTPVTAPGFIERLGLGVLHRTGELQSFAKILGQVLLLLPRFVTARAKVRRSEMLDALAESGTRALVIVSIVNLLVGAILAFVGAVQLKAFGAGIYVADLVGIASVRELTPIMTAIVLAGRTGASFAARIATMQGNEEIDALTTLGVSPVEFLVLPRVVALSLFTPLVYVYGCVLSILGGLLVATPLLKISATAYMVETQLAVGGANFALGGLKAFVFGALVALIGCHCGLRAGRSAADVGLATTTAVTRSIVVIIAVDAIVAVCANALDI